MIVHRIDIVISLISFPFIRTSGLFLPVSYKQHVVKSYFNPPPQFLSSLDIFDLFILIIIIDVFRLKPAILLLSLSGFCFCFLYCLPVSYMNIFKDFLFIY